MLTLNGLCRVGLCGCWTVAGTGLSTPITGRRDEVAWTAGSGNRYQLCHNALIVMLLYSAVFVRLQL